MKEQSDPPYIPSPTKAYARTPRNNHCKCEVVVERKPYYYRGQGCWQRDSRGLLLTAAQSTQPDPVSPAGLVECNTVVWLYSSLQHLASPDNIPGHCNAVRLGNIRSCLVCFMIGNTGNTPVTSAMSAEIVFPPTLRLLFSFLVHCNIVKENQG